MGPEIEFCVLLTLLSLRITDSPLVSLTTLHAMLPDSFSQEDSSSKLDSVICTENTSTLMTMFKKRDHSRLFLMLVLPEPPPVPESSVSSRVHAMEVLTFHITPRDSQVTPELKLSKLSTREVRRLTIPKELRLTSMPSNTETESWATTLPFT